LGPRHQLTQDDQGYGGVQLDLGLDGRVVREAAVDLLVVLGPGTKLDEARQALATEVAGLHLGPVGLPDDGVVLEPPKQGPRF